MHPSSPPCTSIAAKSAPLRTSWFAPPPVTHLVLRRAAPPCHPWIHVSRFRSQARRGSPDLKGRSKVVVVPHKHDGVFIAKAKHEDKSEVEYRDWNTFSSKFAAAVLSSFDNICQIDFDNLPAYYSCSLIEAKHVLFLKVNNTSGCSCTCC